MQYDPISVVDRLFHRGDNSAGALLAPLLRSAVVELRRRHVAPQLAVAAIQPAGETDCLALRVTRRAGWWLNLYGATAHRQGAALWIDRDGRHWDDDSDPSLWHLESARYPTRLPEWTLRTYGPRLRNGRPATLKVVADDHAPGGLAVVGSTGRDHHAVRWPFADLLARGIASAAEVAMTSTDDRLRAA